MKLEYFIFVTNECNLGCSYCSIFEFAVKNDIPITPQYDIEELKEFIEQTQKKYESESFDVILFGGEPSLNTDFIRKVIEEIRSALNKYSINFILHTNGITLSNIDKNLIERFSMIIVSINYERIPSHHLFDSYFGELVQNINHVRNRSTAIFMGRLTITENVSLYTNVLQMSNFFDFIYWQIQNCQAFRDFNSFLKTYAFELNLLWDYWLKYLRNGHQLNFIPFMSAVQLSMQERINKNNYLCGYNEFMIYIQTDGKCYSCAEEILSDDHFLIGNIRNGISFKPQNVSANILCGECNYIKLCGGRCGRMQERFSQDHIKEYCKLNMLLFDKVLSIKSVFKEIYNKYPDFKRDVEDPIFRITEYVP